MQNNYKSLKNNFVAGRKKRRILILTVLEVRRPPKRQKFPYYFRSINATTIDLDN